MSQEALGEALGIGRSTVIRYESGQTLPNSDVIVRLCAVFGVSADYLLGLSGEGRSPGEDSAAADASPARGAPAQPALTREMREYIDKAVAEAVRREWELRGLA